MPRTTVTTMNGQLTELTCWPDRLRDVRTSLGFSQSTLAREAYIRRSTLCDIEKGRRNPSYQTAARIARALDVQISVFCRVRSVDGGDESVA